MKLARQADSVPVSELGDSMEERSELNPNQHAAALLIHNAFTYCLNDRNKWHIASMSRRAGVYRMASRLISMYIRVSCFGSAELQLGNPKTCYPIFKTIESYSTEMQAFEEFPMSHQVEYQYYQGLLEFMMENYAKVGLLLFIGCRLKSTYLLHLVIVTSMPRSRESILILLICSRLILKFLIPSRLLFCQIPNAKLLERYPNLNSAYGGLFKALRMGNPGLYEAEIRRVRGRLMKMKTYWAFIRASWLPVRSLVKQIWRLNNESPRIELLMIQRAFLISQYKDVLTENGKEIDADAVEATLVVAISKVLFYLYLYHRDLSMGL